jgi:hypothetical protein
MVRRIPIFVGLIIVGYLLTLTVVWNPNLSRPCFDPAINTWQCPSFNQGLPLAFVGVYFAVFGFVSVVLLFVFEPYPRERWIGLGSLLLALLSWLVVMSPLLFYCCFSSIYVVEADNLTLYSGPVPTSPTCSPANSAYMLMSLNNHSVGATNITKITITGTSVNTTINGYYVRPNGCSQISSNFGPHVFAATITNHRVYFGGKNNSVITAGGTYNYEIDFANGDSITGSLQAQ